jgi:hypothetical protein
MLGTTRGDTITVRVVNLDKIPIQDVKNPATGTPLFAGVPVNLTVSNVADRANPIAVKTMNDINTRGEPVDIDPAVRDIQLVFDDGNGARILKTATLVGISNTTQTITVVMPQQDAPVHCHVHYCYPAKHTHVWSRHRHY